MVAKHKRKNIVVVEDDEMYSMFLTHYLRNNMGDVNVTVAETGETGLNLIRMSEPDAVILDYYLDDMTGLEILKKIKQDFPTMIVIVVSAQKKIDTAVELLKEGANAYISKNPDSALEMLQSLEAAFEKQSQKFGTLNLTLNISKRTFVKIAILLGLGLLALLILRQVLQSVQ